MNVEHGHQFIDTNVLVYAHDDCAGARRTRAQEVLADLWESGLGCLSIQVMQEFFTTVTRKISHPLSPDEAAGIVSYLAQWRVHSPVAADVLAAIGLARQHQISYWDAAIVVSAQRLGCHLLWSEDLQDGAVYGHVAVRNPFSRTGLVQEPVAEYAGKAAGQAKARRGRGI